MDNVVSKFLAEIARHITRCHFMHETRLTIRLDDVVGDVPGRYLSPHHGMMPFDKKKKSRCDR